MQVLLVYSDKPPILFVKRDLLRASVESPLKTEEMKSLVDLKKFIPHGIVGIEFSRLSVAEYKKLKDIFNCEFYDISNQINKLRAFKSDYELSLMKQAGAIAEKVYIESMNFLQKGITEIEFGSIMFSLAQKYGHEGVLRTSSPYFEPVSWHILSGKSGCVHGQYDAPVSGIGLSPAFPNSAGRKKIKEHEPVMVDFGITYMGYQVDTTRMYCIGEPDEKFLFYYEKALSIKKKIIESIVHGASCDFLFETGKKEAEKSGIFGNYLGLGKFKKKFVGHGVGLETSEIPLIAKNSSHIIKERMTFALEPKLVIEDFGVVGIENTYVLTERGVEKLTDLSENILTVH